jgi:hypothetical protein
MLQIDAYTEDAREDIMDAKHLRALFDEVQTLLDDILRRLEALENR